LKKARSLAVGWGLFLLLLTSWPSPPAIPVVSRLPDADKATHLLLYGIQGLLLYRAIGWPGAPGLSLLRVLAVTGALAVWATADELHQAFIPGRMFSAADFVADTAGGAAGALAAGLAERARGVRKLRASRNRAQKPTREGGPVTA
jgi:VanZ family protein